MLKYLPFLLVPFLASAFYRQMLVESNTDYPPSDPSEPQHLSWELGTNDAYNTEVIILDSDCSCP
jgi:hypothetical protein